MEHSITLSKDEITRLEQFHSSHFPNQTVPIIHRPVEKTETAVLNEQDDDDDDDDQSGLGFYSDGAKCTLTDDQIAMFRNSEIQRIVKERRKAEEDEETRKQQSQRRQDRGQARQMGSKTWTRHFDEASQSIDTLMYDDERTEGPQTKTGPQTFSWPHLG